MTITDRELGRLRFRCTNAMELARVKTLYTKEEGTIEWMRGLRPGDTFWDVGANIGLYTVLAAKKVGPSGRVIAFEPHVANAAALFKNLQLNDLLDRVHLVTLPLASEAIPTAFNYGSLASGSSGSEAGTVLAAAAWKQFTHSIRGDDLAEWQPDVIKIDVDGNECDVLEGMYSILNLVQSVQVEAVPNNVAKINFFLAVAGLELEYWHLTSAGKEKVAAGADPATVIQNAVFRRKSNGG